MLSLITADNNAEYEFLREMKKRAALINRDISRSVEDILRDIEENGLDALNRYSEELDGERVYEVPRGDIDSAYEKCPEDLRRALEKAAGNIRAYQKKTVDASWEWSPKSGIRLGQRQTALDRVGVYVPGGTAAYPSSVLMNVIPAKVAGVREVIMVTPPKKPFNNAVLAAAKIAGVDRVFAVGGAQAIAALTYGVSPIPAVDKIVGPGNAYVAAAKRLVFGRVDIDMVAGPSEILIVADKSANPKYIAADMLSQAEHDELASSILISTAYELAEKVIHEIKAQSENLPRRGIIEKSLSDFGAVIVEKDIDSAFKLVNEIAPEHLEIITQDADAHVELVKNAGAVFLGAYSPEPLGDYMAGPSHVLPTSGTARFFSPLSASSFIKKTSIIKYDKAALYESAEDIILLANSEDLTAHANSISVRKGS